MSSKLTGPAAGLVLLLRLVFWLLCQAPLWGLVNLVLAIINVLPRSCRLGAGCRLMGGGMKPLAEFALSNLSLPPSSSASPGSPSPSILQRRIEELLEKQGLALASAASFDSLGIAITSDGKLLLRVVGLHLNLAMLPRTGDRGGGRKAVPEEAEKADPSPPSTFKNLTSFLLNSLTVPLLDREFVVEITSLSVSLACNLTPGTSDRPIVDERTVKVSSPSFSIRCKPVCASPSYFAVTSSEITLAYEALDPTSSVGSGESASVSLGGISLAMSNPSASASGEASASLPAPSKEPSSSYLAFTLSSVVVYSSSPAVLSSMLGLAELRQKDTAPDVPSGGGVPPTKADLMKKQGSFRRHAVSMALPPRSNMPPPSPCSACKRVQSSSLPANVLRSPSVCSRCLRRTLVKQVSSLSSPQAANVDLELSCERLDDEPDYYWDCEHVAEDDFASDEGDAYGAADASAEFSLLFEVSSFLATFACGDGSGGNALVLDVSDAVFEREATTKRSSISKASVRINELPLAYFSESVVCQPANFGSPPEDEDGDSKRADGERGLATQRNALDYVEKGSDCPSSTLHLQSVVYCHDDKAMQVISSYNSQLVSTSSEKQKEKKGQDREALAAADVAFDTDALEEDAAESAELTPPRQNYRLDIFCPGISVLAPSSIPDSCPPASSYSKRSVTLTYAEDHPYAARYGRAPFFLLEVAFSQGSACTIERQSAKFSLCSQHSSQMKETFNLDLKVSSINASFTCDNEKRTPLAICAGKNFDSKGVIRINHVSNCTKYQAATNYAMFEPSASDGESKFEENAQSVASVISVDIPLVVADVGKEDLNLLKSLVRGLKQSKTHDKKQQRNGHDGLEGDGGNGLRRKGVRREEGEQRGAVVTKGLRVSCKRVVLFMHEDSPCDPFVNDDGNDDGNEDEGADEENEENEDRKGKGEANSLVWILGRLRSHTVLSSEGGATQSRVKVGEFTIFEAERAPNDGFFLSSRGPHRSGSKRGRGSGGEMASVTARRGEGDVP